MEASVTLLQVQGRVWASHSNFGQLLMYRLLSYLLLRSQGLQQPLELLAMYSWNNDCMSKRSASHFCAV